MIKASAQPVPFVDLSHVNAVVEADVLSDVAALLRTGEFTNGPHVERFEQAFATFCNARECVGVSSGLDALRLALIAVGVGPGDEVVVPAQTFTATLEAVVQAGAAPVIVDVSERDWNLDVDRVADAVSARTRCLLPVHLFGQMADMERIRRVGAKLGLPVLEDACQAHGADRDGIRPGELSVAAAFSFYPTKNLGGLGDGGALITDDAAVANCARCLRQHGVREKHVSDRIGYTARLDTLQAAVLLRKLPLLEEANRMRREAALRYTDALRNIGDIEVLPVPDGSQPAWHLFPVRSRQAGELGAFLAARGVQTGRHYPTPPHLQPAYAQLGYAAGTFPVAERLALELISLPMFPGISEGQLSWTIQSIKHFFARVF